MYLWAGSTYQAVVFHDGLSSPDTVCIVSPNLRPLRRSLETTLSFGSMPLSLTFIGALRGLVRQRVSVECSGLQFDSLSSVDQHSH